MGKDKFYAILVQLIAYNAALSTFEEPFGELLAREAAIRNFVLFGADPGIVERVHLTHEAVCRRGRSTYPPTA